MSFAHTDLGNAHRFVEQHGENVRYVSDWNKWLVWSDTRWQVDEEGAVPRKAYETAHSILNEIDEAGSAGSRGDIVKHWLRSESEPKLRAMRNLAANFERIVVRASDLDADPMLIAFENGVLDLRTSEIRPAKREDLITKQARPVYDPDATAPRWTKYLDEVMGDKVEVRDYLQRAVGYSLTGKTGEQVLFFLHGLGANGKSILLATLRELLGEYAASADFTTFLERRSDGPRSDLARLQGARFVSAIEASEGRRLNEGVVKQLTGEDGIVARFLYGSEFEFRPQFKLWFAANHKPVIRGTDPAIWRRIHMVPFTVTIPEEARDPNLREILIEELPGILNWAIEGCGLWQEYGLRPPAQVTKATEEYRSESDIVGKFLEERCAYHPDASAPATELYNAYKLWCESAGEYRLSQTAFGTKLSDKGFESVKHGGKKTKVRLGLYLLPAEVKMDGDSWRQSKPVSGISAYSAHEEFSQKSLELSPTVSRAGTDHPKGQLDEVDL